MPLVLVTGGASGIGAATCEALDQAGYDTVAADISPSDGVLSLDVTDEASWDAALDAVAGVMTCNLSTP